MGNNKDDDLYLQDDRNIHDNSQDNSANDRFEHEKLIDPGNEHSHNFDEKKFENDITRTEKPKAETDKEDPANETGKTL